MAKRHQSPRSLNFELVCLSDYRIPTVWRSPGRPQCAGQGAGGAGSACALLGRRRSSLAVRRASGIFPFGDSRRYSTACASSCRSPDDGWPNSVACPMSRLSKVRCQFADGRTLSMVRIPGDATRLRPGETEDLCYVGQEWPTQAFTAVSGQPIARKGAVMAEFDW